MAREVELPDGRIIEVPDDATPEQLTALKDKLRDKYSSKAIETAAPDRKEPIPKERTFLENVGKGAERIAGTIGNMVGGNYPDPVRPHEVGDIAENFVRSTTAPLGGDYIAAAASAATGKGYNPEEQRARREELASRDTGSGVTAAAGELLGAGGVGKVVAPAGGGIVAQGAATGAITAANESGGDLGAAARGAAAGAVGGKVLEKIGEAFAPMAALAKRLKTADGKAIKPQELYATFQRLEQQLGRKPTIAELADEAQTKALTSLAEGRRGAMSTFEKAQEAKMAARPGELRASITRGQPTTGAEEMLAQRDEAFTQAMNPIRGTQVTVGPQSAQRFLHQDVIRSLPADLRDRLINAVNDQTALFATVGELDSLRRALGKAAQTAERDGFDVDALRRARASARIAAEKVPEYKRALADYEGRSETAKGAARGEKIRSESEGDLMDASRRLTPQARTGLEIGARKALSEAAGASETGAIRTAQELTQPGTRAKVAASMGQSEADRIAAVGAAETRGARNMAAITKRGMDEVIDPSDVKKIAGLAATAAIKTKSPGLIVQGASALLKPLKALGLAPGVGRKIAEIATSPNGAEQLVAYLRRAKVGDTTIQKIAKAIGVPLGAVVGSP